jgi:hypothetical protein
MCLQKMEERRLAGLYRCGQQMRDDFELMVLNCLTYNPKVTSPFSS